MSWATVRAALATRVDAVTGITNVHQFIRYTDDGSETAAFGALFVASGVLQAWLITRTGMRTEVCEDDDNRYRRRHDVEIQGVYALKDSTSTENTFQGLLDAMEADLRTGDRTISSTCLTHTLPEFSPINHVSFQGVLCHGATIRFTVEEIA